MFINNSYSLATNIVNTIQNPALPIGTLIEEIPADIGRSYEGYKRGGIIEGAEKLRKEVMAAIVWLFGMPVFRAIGDKICEYVLKIPMNIDYSNAKEGNDSIGNSLKYLKYKVVDSSTPDVSELKNVSAKILENIKKTDLNELVKKVTFAKKVTSISALVLNCVAMGIILPKFNQMLTRKKLAEMQKNSFKRRFVTFDEFQEKIKKDSQNSPVSFTGLAQRVSSDISNYGLSGYVTYNVENNNVFRLLSTDVPMTGGRVLTSRNGFEGLENFVMDVSSAYFYNFCAGHVQEFLRNKFDIPNVNPVAVEAIRNSSETAIEDAIKNLRNIPTDAKEKLRYIFKSNNSLADEIYKQATYGKYGKINRFVKNSDITSIDDSIIKFLSQAESKCCVDGKFNFEEFKKFSKKVNRANSKYLTIGLTVAIFGLAIFVPKMTFWITRKLTGRNEFTGLADYSDLKKDKNKKNVNKS